MSESEARFTVLRQSADPLAAAGIERLVRDGTDRELHRINVIDFAAANGLPVDRALDAFLHATRLGMFEMSWNVLCPGCGGVLNTNATLKTIHQHSYACALCAAGYEPSLDEMVEVAFSVSPRVRQIAAHAPEQLPMWEYVRQMYWSSGIEFPAEMPAQEVMERFVIDWTDLGAGDKATMSLQLPAGFIILFEPVTHSAQFLDVQGEPTRERQELGVVFNNVQAPTGTVPLRPGPLRLTMENRTDARVLPALYIAGDDLHHMLGKRKKFLTARTLLTNQTFRDLYRADMLAMDQRLKITSLTFVFTDLKASTELYERVGDLAAYELVKAHFGVLNEVVARESGAVVKTIGDAVMASFPTPDRGIAAVLGMREAMKALNASRHSEDLTLKIGIHEGPCLAVTLNDRLDYFGQTVNIAARVQGLAQSHAIFATEPVVRHADAARLLAQAGLTPVAQRCNLRGIAEELTVYEIP
ncbi:adenylate/guanylate cyclase domain-containing protein [Caenimonas aquaedulcis]|uniref:Adenylate/guanylate cyclase domain-containing protein n=1 Tax=Caenimonas aquaedulcis TaxID=2793270 RepID=A0A931MFM5_9BURK|nr:adenylate/guanylate cyclase domain-containing protein [Caenimonas aquaedulcis]MBG9386615.1 adenylate/guanylate cyclase domain-containing protein [Caenimonas aquaedulcis]